MLVISLFILAIVSAVVHMAYYRKDWNASTVATVLLSYILFFNMGIMGLLAAYAHVFMGPETAREIGWEPESPFQFEMGMANLAFGVLGILSYWIRGRFWDAACIGWAILLIGCFVGHVINYYTFNNTAPYNIGISIWFFDLFIPILALGLLAYIRTDHSK
jgi:hypothetical protein